MTARSANDARNSVVEGVMGSTARRGGDGVRYRGGRSPRGFKKDTALIISALSEGVQEVEMEETESAVREDALAVGGCKAGMLNHTD